MATIRDRHCGECPRADLDDTSDYFALFGFAPGLNIDEEALRRRYFELSRELHPDLHPNDDDEQQPQIVTLKALWGSGDETEPVVAIMLPNEH